MTLRSVRRSWASVSVTGTQGVMPNHSAGLGAEVNLETGRFPGRGVGVVLLAGLSRRSRRLRPPY